MRILRGSKRTEMTDDQKDLFRMGIYGAAIALASIAITVLSFEVLKTVVNNVVSTAF